MANTARLALSATAAFAAHHPKLQRLQHLGHAPHYTVNVAVSIGPSPMEAESQALFGSHGSGDCQHPAAFVMTAATIRLNATVLVCTLPQTARCCL